MALTLVRREGNLLATGTWGRHTAKGGGTTHRASGLSKAGYDESVQISIYGPNWASLKWKQSLCWDLWSVLLPLIE